MDVQGIYLQIINSLRDGVYFVDQQRRITFWNKGAEAITGYTKEDVLGIHCYQNILDHIDEHGKQLCVFGCPLHSTLEDGQRRNAEVFLRHKDGHRLPVLINIFPIKEYDEIIGAIEVFTPSSGEPYDACLIQRLSENATTDQLTSIANRWKLESYFEYKLNEYKRFKNLFCTAFIDIDDFRLFNNTHGHKVGDEVLKGISKSIVSSMRGVDIIGRWGGEEFVGFFGIKEEKDAETVAEKLRVLVERTEVFHQGKRLYVTASIGVTVARESDTLEEIVKRADTFMYRSKQRGKNCVTSDRMQEQADQAGKENNYDV